MVQRCPECYSVKMSHFLSYLMFCNKSDRGAKNASKLTLSRCEIHEFLFHFDVKHFILNFCRSVKIVKVNCEVLFGTDLGGKDRLI